jgi:hypothetical protein
MHAGFGKLCFWARQSAFGHGNRRGKKAYKQDPEAMEAFKKTFPPAWRRSALSLRLAHR